jgi:hypothetical protein
MFGLFYTKRYCHGAADWNQNVITRSNIVVNRCPVTQKQGVSVMIHTDELGLHTTPADDLPNENLLPDIRADFHQY